MTKRNPSISQMAIRNISKLTPPASGSARTLVNGQVIVMLDPDQVIVEKQVRKTLKNIQELADSIENQDQQQPIIVRHAGAGQRDMYILEKGERRLAACRLKNRHVAAIVTNAKYDSLTAHASQLVENIQRDNLEPFDIADGLQRFVEEGWPQRKIAEFLGKERSYVSLYLSLAKASESIRALFEESVVQDPESLSKLRQLVELEPDEEKALLERIRKEGRLSRSQIRNWLAWAKEAVDIGDKPSAFIAQQEAAAVSNATPKASAGSKKTATQPVVQVVGAGVSQEGNISQGSGADEVNNSGESTTTTTTTTKTTKVEESANPEDNDHLEETSGFKDINTPAALKTIGAPAAQPSHKPPSQPTPIPANNGQQKAVSELIAHDGYVEYPIGRLIVYVEVNGEQGELLTNLLDDDPEYMWVLIDATEIRVHVDEIVMSCMQPRAGMEQ